MLKFAYVRSHFEAQISSIRILYYTFFACVAILTLALELFNVNSRVGNVTVCGVVSIKIAIS